ncbi:MAG: hypothetical protein RLZZ253_286 [Verrucomicrobiota bacterium]
MQLDFSFLRRALIPPGAPVTPPPPCRKKTAAQTPKKSKAQSFPPEFEAGTLETKARQLLAEVGCAVLAQKLQVRWNSRMRSTAGMAYPTRVLVTLNPRLISFGREEVDRTLRHELAHLVAHARVGRRRIAAHGPEWRQACIDLGLLDERRCHDLPLPKRSIRRSHFYQCPACGTELARVRPLKRKSACLACCKKHARGKYDERFRFVKIAQPRTDPV